MTNQVRGITIATVIAMLGLAAYVVLRYRSESLPSTVFWIIGGVNVLIIGGCYAWMPTRVRLFADRLEVVFPFTKRVFQRNEFVRATATPLSLGMRVFGNGGLFSFTGLFRVQGHGTVLCYSRGQKSGMLLARPVERKVFLAIENAEAFATLFQAQSAQHPAE